MILISLHGDNPVVLVTFTDDNHDVHYPSDLKSLPSGDLLAVPSATKDLTSVIGIYICLFYSLSLHMELWSVINI